MKRLAISVALLILVSAAASASKLSCSIHPKKGTPDSELSAMAKVSLEDARKTALASIKNAAATTATEGELESEHGCLVYSFDIQIPGKKGVEEVLVDAGSGKVLSRKHESAAKEAMEKAGEKTEHEHAKPH